jgi:hypothetical protein
MLSKFNPAPATAIAVVALFVALGGVGSAANGDKLTLGQSNSATSQTSLSAPVPGGKAFQVTNSDSTNGASTALGLKVAAGHPPFTVNSSTKVTSLNADSLDGLDSTGFWKLGGNAVGSTGALGTTTNEPLVLKVNGQRALRLEPNATSPNLIGGFYGNAAQNGADGATIAGGGENGYPNFVSDTFGTVGGGESNRADSSDGNPQTAPYATVAGGKNNTAGGYSSTVGGGYKNTSNVPFSTVAGGASNTAGNTEATVGGGDSNTADGFKATIAGGAYNTASGSHSAVPGGLGNAAGGEGSFAVGFSAQAIYDHSFVWSDGNFSTSIASPAADSFTAHATGGFKCGCPPAGYQIFKSTYQKRRFSPVADRPVAWSWSLLRGLGLTRDQLPFPSSSRWMTITLAATFPETSGLSNSLSACRRSRALALGSRPSAIRCSSRT